jgi:heme exporter protein B
LQVARDLRLALRRGHEWLQPLLFFLVIATLFPLTFDSQLSRLRDVAPAALWVSALLSSLLALELLFRDDSQDGTLEQLVTSGAPLAWLLLAKTAVHWLLTGLPLVLVAPLVATALGAPNAAILPLLAPVVVGSAALSLIGAIGAALTLGLRRGGVLLGLLTLPLSVPVLIFGARASALAIAGESMVAPMYLLAAVAMLVLALAPLAMAAAVRINVE